MNNEPVAYINVEERKLEWAKPMTWHTPTIAQMEKIPLYTHPVKDLTDDEIHELANEHLRTKDHDGAKVVLGLENFAKALMEKMRNE